MGWGLSWLAKLADVGEARTPEGRALLEERYSALLRQIPLLYIVALVNFLGLHVATGGRIELVSPATFLIGLVLVRLAHWLRARRRRLAPETILRELRKTCFYATVVSLGFFLWALSALQGEKPEHIGHVILFGTLAGVGCSYGLASFPAAARIPLLLLAMPLGIRMIATGTPAHIGLGISIVIVILLILHLLSIHNHRFRELVESRSKISAERERARRAERLAKAAKAKAKRIADTDPLTGLANRRAFLRLLGARAAAVARTGRRCALAMVDLDGFKPINDTFGHATGDGVLTGIGERLSAAAGEAAVIARTGGDEFALLLPGVGTPQEAVKAGATICAALQQPFNVDGREFRISGCCGLSLLSRDDCEPREALIRADTALYRAKEKGRAGVAVFSQEMQDVHRRRADVEKALRLPETQDQIGLVYQPIVDLATGELRSLEALARWQDEVLGRVSPSQFIPVAEQINLIEQISEKLLARAAAEARRWSGEVKLSFNVSAVQLCTTGSADRMLRVLSVQGLDPTRLQVEVTETALLADLDVARENLLALRLAGARIVLDDFGAGHASISYLREMRFDAVKLDGALIASVSEGLKGRRLLKGVLDLCAALGLPSVAEHVETEDQLRLLRELGCREGQGFLLSPPLHPEAAAALAAPKVVGLAARRAAA